MSDLAQIALLALSIAKFFVFAHFIMSWLISFQVLNLQQPFVYQMWNGLQQLLEPVYRPIRNMLPPMGGLDLSPIVVLFGIMCLEILIR